MGENTKIEWADHTFNPWIGCAKVSKGCMNCYAERDMDHRFGKVEWGPRGDRIITSDANWRKPLKWNKRARENGKVELVFCASLGDVFEDPVSPDLSWDLSEARERLFDMIEKTPWLIWLVLTKRPELVMRMVPPNWLNHTIAQDGSGGHTTNNWPQNVWVGFSAEDQSNFDYRIGYALAIPTPVRWMSAEPLLGHIRTNEWLEHIGWIIVGGESGPDARPMHPAWANEIEVGCSRHNVPFFFKQWGEWVPLNATGFAGGECVDVADGRNGQHALMERLGRNKTGRLLNGREYLEFPVDVIKEYELNLDIKEAKAAIRHPDTQQHD